MLYHATRGTRHDNLPRWIFKLAQRRVQNAEGIGTPGGRDRRSNMGPTNHVKYIIHIYFSILFNNSSLLYHLFLYTI